MREYLNCERMIKMIKERFVGNNMYFANVWHNHFNHYVKVQGSKDKHDMAMSAPTLMVRRNLTPRGKCFNKMLELSFFIEY